MNCSSFDNNTEEICDIFELQVLNHWQQFPSVSWVVCYIWGSILLVIGVVGISGNGIVLFVFTRFRRLRGPFSCFIINLATADFCSSILHLMAVSSCYYERWLYGSVGCQFYACAIGLFGLVSIVTLSTIAIERYVVITAKPFSGSWRITQCGAKKVCLAVWIYCAAMVLPPLFGWSKYVPEGFMTSCSWDYLSRDRWNRAYYLYLLILGFVIPVVIITYCYTFILAAIIAHSREMEHVKSTGGKKSGSFTYSLSRGVAYCINPRKLSQKKVHTSASSTIRSAEIILMLILLFMVAWLPYAVVTIIGQFGDAQLISPWVAALPGLFAKTSVIYNPIVYGLSHPTFRTSLRQYLSSGNGSIIIGGTSLVSAHNRNPSRRATSSPTAFEMNSLMRRNYSMSCRERTVNSRLAVVQKGKTEPFQWSPEMVRQEQSCSIHSSMGPTLHKAVEERRLQTRENESYIRVHADRGNTVVKSMNAGTYIGSPV